MKTASQFVWGLCALVSAAFVLVGCQSTPPPTFSSGFDMNDPLFISDPLVSGGTNGLGRTIIKQEDSITVTFLGPEGQVLPPFEGRVSEEGTITLQLIGAVKAAGKSAGELQKDIHDAFVPKFFQRLTVTVREQDRFYYVGGEVKSPNRYTWAGEITLTKAIQTASDFTDWANKKKVTITRADGKAVGPINCVRVLDGKLADPRVYPGDKIYVPRRGF